MLCGHVQLWNHFMAGWCHDDVGAEVMRRVLHVGYRFAFTAEMNERHSSRGSNPLSQLLARFNSLGDKACTHPGVQSKRPAWAAPHMSLAAVTHILPALIPHSNTHMYTQYTTCWGIYPIKAVFYKFRVWHQVILTVRSIEALMLTQTEYLTLLVWVFWYRSIQTYC